ncbi:enoyl-CoA hydratase [Primorskyibacter sedentarius]|uniref:Enoyl-CoA hydratase n=1 Tax=Primorskyibacter sedentarius TaxID=745311 RepID=A0A4R3INU5_9RHOB|nr:enoyl-CoA hydratase-related protein [Primorskyibacter sedentarius]TCS51827.1 enoyl-CoA hydratase [Primorskyibacter sedentarius]
MAYETLLWSLENDVAEIVMTRNASATALNARMCDELFDAACRCETEGARAVILTGTGKTFNVGGDLSEFSRAKNKAEHVTRMATMVHAAISRFAHMDAPLISAVNGSAGGAGFSMALAADIVLASEHARFVSAYTASGLSPDGSLTYYLAKHIGLLRAKELILTNRVLSAQEACKWGLVTRVVASGQMIADARKLATELASGPTRAFGGAKRLLDTAYSESLETQLDKETRSIAEMMRTDDGQTGIEAFLSKQKPSFRGA